MESRGVTVHRSIPAPFDPADLRLTPLQLMEKYGRDVDLELLGWETDDGLREFLEQPKDIDEWPHPDYWPMHPIGKEPWNDEL